MIALPLHTITLRTRQQEGVAQVFDPVRRLWVVLTPEEHVRQLLLHYLIHAMNYPAALIAVERAIGVGSLTRRFDIVVYDRSHAPWLLVECKRPDVAITEDTLHQLLAYHSALPSRYWLLCNGPQTFCADARNIAAIEWLPALPPYHG